MDIDINSTSSILLTMGPPKNSTTSATSAMQNATNRGQSSTKGNEQARQKETPKAGRTKENRTNTTAGPATSVTHASRPALGEITDGANTFEAMNARILEIQGISPNIQAIDKLLT